MNEEINNQVTDQTVQNQENNQGNPDQKKKKDLKTNKVVVLEEDPIQVEIKFTEEEEENNIGSIPTPNVAAPVSAQPAQQELPTEQSGNITF